MKKAVMMILGAMILSVMTAMGALITMLPEETAVENIQQEAVVTANRWNDVKGRCSTQYLAGWKVLDVQQSKELLDAASQQYEVVASEQADLMRKWVNTGDSVMFVSPDHKASVIISCRTMDRELTDAYVTNLRNGYAQQVEKKYEHIGAGTEMDMTLAQTGNRISGVRCDNLHPSRWLQRMEESSSHVFFTYKGKNLYTIVISDATVRNNAEVHNQLFDTLELA